MRLSQEVMLHPFYEVYIDGIRLGDNLKKYITSVEFEESDSEADVARITIADSDFIFSNNVKLAKKVPFKLIMGYVKKHRMMLDGEITHLEVDFGENGVPSIVIGAVNKLNKMTTENKERSWKNSTLADVVSAVAKDYGMKSVVQSVSIAKETQFTQNNETDAQFLARLANTYALNFYVIPETNTLYFGERLTGITSSAVLQYNYGNCMLRNFRPTLVQKNREEAIETKNETAGDISDKTGKTVTATTGEKEKKTLRGVLVDTTTSKATKIVLPVNSRTVTNRE